jgi:hypothetical protein
VVYQATLDAGDLLQHPHALLGKRAGGQQGGGRPGGVHLVQEHPRPQPLRHHERQLQLLRQRRLLRRPEQASHEAAVGPGPVRHGTGANRVVGLQVPEGLEGFEGRERGRDGGGPEIAGPIRLALQKPVIIGAGYPAAQDLLAIAQSPRPLEGLVQEPEAPLHIPRLFLHQSLRELAQGEELVVGPFGLPEDVHGLL